MAWVVSEVTQNVFTKFSQLLYTGEFWHRKKLVNLVNRELFTKIFLTIIHTPKIYLGYALTSLFAIFFLASSFYLYGSPKFSPAKIFPCMVCCIHLLYLIDGVLLLVTSLQHKD